MSWIKMRTDLRDHPKVVRMASALKADRLRVIGGLWAVWGTFDTHSVDGELEGYTLATLDEGIGWRGFSAALAAVRWLVETDDGLEIPEFEEHNGASAKRRATDAKRKASDREEDKGARGSWNAGGQVSASQADKKEPRVRVEKEKEKEEREKDTAQSAKRGSRLPPDWSPAPDGLAFSAGLINGRTESELAKFRDYWAAQPGQKGVKTDWPATWRNWVRRASETPAKAGQPSADVFAGSI